MKCPNCGTENSSNVCSLCGTNLTRKVNITQYLKNISLPVKIVAVIWTIACIVEFFPSKEHTILQKLLVFVTGYIIYCGIAHLVYKIYKKKHSAPSDILYSTTTNKAFNYTITDYDSLDGHAFEYFCAEVLRKNGFFNVEVTQGSGDHGIDILAEKEGISYAIQCKCYSSNIGNAAVQQAHTGKSIYKKDIAVVLTNRYFTAQAQEEANALGVKLWDRDKLNAMIGTNPTSQPSQSTVSVDAAKEILKPHVYNQALHTLERYCGDDKKKLIRLFSESQGIDIAESRTIVNEWWKINK